SIAPWNEGLLPERRALAAHSGVRTNQLRNVVGPTVAIAFWAGRGVRTVLSTILAQLGRKTATPCGPVGARRRGSRFEESREMRAQASGSPEASPSDAASAAL